MMTDSLLCLCTRIDVIPDTPIHTPSNPQSCKKTGLPECISKRSWELCCLVIYTVYVRLALWGVPLRIPNSASLCRGCVLLCENWKEKLCNSPYRLFLYATTLYILHQRGHTHTHTLNFLHSVFFFFELLRSTKVWSAMHMPRTSL